MKFFHIRDFYVGKLNHVLFVKRMPPPSQVTPVKLEKNIKLNPSVSNVWWRGCGSVRTLMHCVW